MQGWIVPPPKEPTKSREEFTKERHKKVEWLIRRGYLRSERIKEAMLRVPREDFIPHMYKDYAYREVPLPIPGQEVYHAHTVTHSFMSPWAWIRATKFSKLVLALAMVPHWQGRLLGQTVWLYPLKSIR